MTDSGGAIVGGESPSPDEEEEAQLRAIVRGMVQGVNFRDYTHRHALRLGLVGWVRNLPNGTTVEVLAQGRRSALERLLAYLQEGPRGAYVAQVDTEWDSASLNLRSFVVR